MSRRAQDFDPVDPIDDADPEDFDRPELRVVRVVDQDAKAVATEEEMMWEETRLILRADLDKKIAAGNNLRRLYPLVQARAPGTWDEECHHRTGYGPRYCNRLIRLAEQAEREDITSSELARYWEQILGKAPGSIDLSSLMSSASPEWYT